MSAQGLFTLLARGVLVGALVERGEFDEAERELEPLDGDLLGMSQTAAMLRHARGRLRLAQRRYADALGDFRAVGDIAVRTRLPSPCCLPWRSDAALAELSIGEPGTAQRLSEEELELARVFGIRRCGRPGWWRAASAASGCCARRWRYSLARTPGLNGPARWPISVRCCAAATGGRRPRPAAAGR